MVDVSLDTQAVFYDPNSIPIFPTRFHKHKAITNSGSRYQVVYNVEYDDEGRLIFEPSSKKDIHAEIQTWRDSCDVKTIIERYMAGDVDALERVQGFYMDITDYPHDYRGVLNLNIKTKNFFDSLPVDIKQEFGNSYEQFMVALGTKEFDERIKNAMHGIDVSNDFSGMVPSRSDDSKVNPEKEE